MESNIFKAIPAVMADIKAIGKNNQNTMQHYKFRGIDDMYNELHDILARHGVFTVPEVLEDREVYGESKSGSVMVTRVLKVKYTIYASDGSFITSVIQGEAMDSSDKASNKAIAAAHKYLFIQLFAIPTEDNVTDADMESPEMKKRQDKHFDEMEHKARVKARDLIESARNIIDDDVLMDLEIRLGAAKGFDDVVKMGKEIRSVLDGLDDEKPRTKEEKARAMPV
jgi:hypothetical protein